MSTKRVKCAQLNRCAQVRKLRYTSYGKMPQNIPVASPSKSKDPIEAPTYYIQPESESKRRERRMKLTGLFMSIALACLAGTLTAIKTQVIAFESIGLVPAAVEAALLLFLWLTTRYQLQDLRCFSQHTTEIEYQTIATNAEDAFKRVFKYLPFMLCCPLLAFMASCLIEYCNISVPYIPASLNCFAAASIIRWLIPKLKEQYVPLFDFLKTFMLLTAITMMCASCI